MIALLTQRLYLICFGSMLNFSNEKKMDDHHHQLWNEVYNSRMFDIFSMANMFMFALLLRIRSYVRIMLIIMMIFLCLCNLPHSHFTNYDGVGQVISF